MKLCVCVCIYTYLTLAFTTKPRHAVYQHSLNDLPIFTYLLTELVSHWLTYRRLKSRVSLCVCVCALFSLHTRSRAGRVPRQTSDVPRNVQLSGLHNALSLSAEATIPHPRTSDVSLWGLSALPGTKSSHLHRRRQDSLPAGQSVALFYLCKK